MIDFENQTKEIKTAVAHVLVYRERSVRLASRLVTIVENLPKMTDTIDTINCKQNPSIQLLNVTVDDVVVYFKAMSLKSPALIAHLLKYGADEECFHKWNERLRMIENALNLNISTSGGEIFDPKLDDQDRKEDIRRLREILPSMTNSIQHQRDILTLLDSKEISSF